MVTPQVLTESNDGIKRPLLPLKCSTPHVWGDPEYNIRNTVDYEEKMEHTPQLVLNSPESPSAGTLNEVIAAAELLFSSVAEKVDTSVYGLRPLLLPLLRLDGLDPIFDPARTPLARKKRLLRVTRREFAQILPKQYVGVRKYDVPGAPKQRMTVSMANEAIFFKKATPNGETEILALRSEKRTGKAICFHSYSSQTLQHIICPCMDTPVLHEQINKATCN